MVTTDAPMSFSSKASYMLLQSAMKCLQSQSHNVIAICKEMNPKKKCLLGNRTWRLSLKVLVCPWISLVFPADILCWKKEMPQLSLKPRVGRCSKTQELSKQRSVYAGGRCFILDSDWKENFLSRNCQAQDVCSVLKALEIKYQVVIEVCFMWSFSLVKIILRKNCFSFFNTCFWHFWYRKAFCCSQNDSVMKCRCR